MNLGSLNLRGVLFANDQTIGQGGAVLETLRRVRSLGVSRVTPVDTQAQFIASRDSEETTAQFMTRWFPGLKDQMVLKVECVSYRIIEHKELGRRMGWLVYGQSID